MKNEQGFEDFQKYFKEYQQRFGLTGYQVYFKHARVDGSFAKININEESKIVTATLNSKLRKSDEPFQDIKKSAKHEALHLLINELEDLAWRKFITKEQITDSSETLVNKLQRLIDD